MVEEFVQAVADDILDVAVGQLRAQLPQAALRRVGEGALRRPGDQAHRLLGLDDAEVDGPREIAVEDEELGHIRGVDASVAFQVHLEGTHRAQQGRPLHVVEGRAHILNLWQQDEVLDVEDPRGLVGALDHAPQLTELPGLAVGHRGGGDTDEGVACILDAVVEVVGELLDLFARCRAHHQVGAVDVFPHLGGDDLPLPTGTLPSPLEAGQDGVGVGAVEGEELDHVLTGSVCVALDENVPVAGDAHQRFPVVVDGNRDIEIEVQVDVDEAGDVLSPLDVAAQPVEGLGGATQHVAEALRIDEIVVDAPIDDVDPLEAPCRPHHDEPVLHHQIAPLYQLDAHLLGEEGMLEVGGVVDAGCEQNDGGIRDVVRRQAAQGIEQAGRVVLHGAHQRRSEDLGGQPGPAKSSS